MLNLPSCATGCRLCNSTVAQLGALMHNLLRHSYPVVQPDSLKATCTTEQSETYPVVQLDDLIATWLCNQGNRKLPIEQADGPESAT